MMSDLPHHQRFIYDQNQHQTNSGLMRYRSAPSSYFTSAMDKEFSEQFFSKPLSPETERIFSRFISGGDGAEDSSTAPNLYEMQKHPPPPPPLQIPEANTSQPQAKYMSSNYFPASQSSSYQFQSKPPLPNQNLDTSINGLPRMTDGCNGGGGHGGGGGGGANSNLIRHNSSPAGLFANTNVESVYGGMRTEMGNYGGKEEESFSPGSRLNNYISRLPSSSSGLMSPIAEIEDKSNIIASWDDFFLSNANIQNQTQNEENPPGPLLAHHLSLPKTAAEMSAIKFLQYSDSIPCKIRAKRGCATHPRSIAERVRRTKISERMRKLQDLVPNMDKQTNTSDMLDLAVDYIKDLQKQVQILSENRAKCKCTSRQK